MNYIDKDVRELFDEIKKYKILNNEEFKDLINKSRNGNIDARNTIIKSNLRLVAKISLKYIGAEIPFRDLFNYGVEGLIIATSKYDINQDVKFSTYAYFWIKQSIIRSIENESKIVRIPSHLFQTYKVIKKMEMEYYQENGIFPSDEYLVTIFNNKNYKYKLTIDALNKLRVYSETTSLNNVIKATEGNEDTEILDFVQEENQYSVEQLFENTFNTNLIKDILEGNIKTGLNEKERLVLWYRYGFDDGYKKTFIEVGNILNLSKQRIQQIEVIALNKLKNSNIIINNFKKH